MWLVTGDVTNSQGVWPSCVNPSVPDDPGSRASLLEHHHLMFLRRGWPPSSGSNAYYFWGKINSVLRCYQKLSHTLNSAMFIEPVKRASSLYGRKGRELGKRGSLRASVRTNLGMWPARAWGHRMLRVDPPHLFTFAEHPRTELWVSGNGESDTQTQKEAATMVNMAGYTPTRIHRRIT